MNSPVLNRVVPSGNKCLTCYSVVYSYIHCKHTCAHKCVFCTPFEYYIQLQIVAAIEKEVQSLRTLTKRNYSYCCGLLVMLTKICQRFAVDVRFFVTQSRLFHSRCDVEVFTQHCNLLVSLTELLLFSAPVVQCQVIDALEKVRKASNK